MAGYVLRCNNGTLGGKCGYVYAPVTGVPIPDTCPRCKHEQAWLVIDSDHAARPVTVPNGPIDAHPYAISKSDWVLLWGYKIDPGCTYDEAT